jgi:hypothetical protein
VDNRDLRRWRNGELRDNSVMSVRIEKVLSRETPLRGLKA